MADTPSEKLSFLEANFVAFGLELVFHGILAVLFIGEFSYLVDTGIYTTLICFLLYYFFGIAESTTFYLHGLLLLCSNER
jgi:hypothetical protein